MRCRSEAGGIVLAAVVFVAGILVVTGVTVALGLSPAFAFVLGIPVGIAAALAAES